MFTRHDFLRLSVAAGALVLAQGCLAQTIPGVMVVTAYGAKGNGVTDDTKAVQAAVNAAEALPGCGTIDFPPGNYVINSGPVIVNYAGCLVRGEGNAWLITDTSGQDIIQVNNRGSGVLFPAPSFENLNFEARSNQRTQNLLHIENANTARVSNSVFYNGAAGIYMNGPNDDSNWNLDNNYFDNNTVAIYCTDICQNDIKGGYIITRNAGDIGVNCVYGVEAGGMIISHVHFAGNQPPNAAAAVETNCNGITVAYNDIEAFAPAVVASHSGGGNRGRGTKIIGNDVLGNCINGNTPVWQIDPTLAAAEMPAVISLNTYECAYKDTDGQ